MNAIWFILAFSGTGFDIFHTTALVGIAGPIIGLLSMVLFQCFSPQKRFSILANILSMFVIGGWFFGVWYLVALASASV